MDALAQLRAQIDQLDYELLQLLARRAQYVHQVGELKHTDEQIVALERQQEVIRTRRAWAQQLGLDPDFVEGLYLHMIHHFIEQERRQLAQRQP